jgi:hypothetical protein
MPTLSYRTTDGGYHRVVVATIGDCPLVLDVADGDARLVDRLDAPGEGPEAAAALAADYCRQCSVARRPLHGAAAPRVALARLRRDHSSRRDEHVLSH